ncbi:AlbA family DNA-binding domain-containing protein [Spirilliplanes yamanashiensis]|uniref:Schlafen AlbA-2 domain-containing protein n=1 Tax=Spirilliplanes yamanashiensis TaxID=42233 RepID=A0A8J4DMI9_9ACTN|nr:hypothetical protein Sya03_58450 [Spirilliplanes yamanashiensis]
MEDDETEFKSSVPPPALIAQQFAAFANSRGGHLYLGIREGPSSSPASRERESSGVERTPCTSPDAELREASG